MNINAIINDQLWKAVPGFPCFEAHPTGLIRNAITGKLISQFSRGGRCTTEGDQRYLSVAMRDVNGNTKNVTVHRVIALTFIDIPAIEDENNWDVDHIDHKTFNNDVRNLRWLPTKLNRMLTNRVRPEVARQRILDYYRDHNIDYDIFNLLSEL